MTDLCAPLSLNRAHISVCICTYKRPQLLERLLLALDSQRRDSLFSFSVVIVDNDIEESAQEKVFLAKQVVKYRIEYLQEPLQNIARARNKAILNADGDYIAMIDDDEIPCNEWLFLLYSTIISSNSDGVLGPVRPSFPEGAPEWLIKSGLCKRSSYPTGTVLTKEDQLRTGNLIYHRRVLNKGLSLFNERYGLTGGEDIEFLDKRIDEGFRFVWCEEAPVFEAILPERWLLSFYVKKSIRLGGLTGEKMKGGEFPLVTNLLKSILLTVGYALLLPVTALFGKHVLARSLVGFMYHLSRLMGTIGIVFIRDR